MNERCTRLSCQRLAAAVKNGGAFAPRGDKTCVRQHLQVVTQRRLTHIEQGTEFGNAKRVVVQGAEDIQPQWVGAGFAQAGKCVTDVRWSHVVHGSLNGL